MDKSEEYFESGFIAFKKGEFSEAQEAFKQCLNEDPLHAKAIYYVKQAEKELEKQEQIAELTQQAQHLFEDFQLQAALVAWMKILALDPNNVFAKTYLEKTKETYQAGKEQGNLVEEGKESEFFKEGLQAFRQKDYTTAGVYWEAALVIDPDNDQARQGLNKAKASQIKEEQDKDSQKFTQINSHLQEGLDLYGSGAIQLALEKWVQILQLDLENKDALEYIVVAKGDLTESDMHSLRVLHGQAEAPTKSAVDTVKLDKDELEADIKEMEDLMLDDEDKDSSLDEQPTDKTTIPPEVEAEIAAQQEAEIEEDLEDFEDEAMPFEDEDSYDEGSLEFEEEEEVIDELTEDESMDLDDDFIEKTPAESEFQVEAGDDFESAEMEFQDDEDDLDDDMAFDDDLLDDDDDIPDFLDDEIEEDYELDDEFIEEEEEEEALAAEHDAVISEEADPDSVQALVDKYFGRGMTLYKARKYEEAIIEWKKIFDIDKDNDQAKEYIEKAITLYEASPFIEEHLTKGNELVADEKYEEAIQEFEKILEIDPEMEEALNAIEQAKTKLSEVVIPARKSKAVNLEEEDLPELEVKKGFDVSSLMQPKMMGIIGGAIAVLLAIGYFAVIKPGQVKKQAAQQQQATQNAKLRLQQQIDEHLRMADMNMKMKNYDKAVHAYQKAVSLDQNNVPAKEGLANAQKLQGVFSLVSEADQFQLDKKFDEAIETYMKAKEVDPGNTLLDEKISETEERKKIYLDQKDRVDKFLAEGLEHFNEGNYNAAIRIYRKALKVLPEDPDAKEAIRRAEFEKRRGKNVQANLKLGLSRYESRKYAEAKEYFNKVLELDPENREAKFYMKKIQDEEKLY